MSAKGDAHNDQIAYTLKSEEFQNVLYRSTLEVAVNRLTTQAKDISEKVLLKYIQELFSVTQNEQETTLKEVRDLSRSQMCLLKVYVEKAENLAAKDVDGSSDPYCLLSVVSNSQYANLRNNKHNVKETCVIGSSLNPQWKEMIEIIVPRNQVDNAFLQLQVWDYDGRNEDVKKVKGVRGIQRYVKEVAQTVGKKTTDEDDFMGFNSVPLANIPAEGLESWFKLRAANPLQNVSGRMKVRLSLTTIQEQSKTSKKYSADLLFAGLQRKVVMQAYGTYYRKNKGEVEQWNGELPTAGNVLLQGLEEQYRIEKFITDIIRWEVFSALHVQRSPGMDPKVLSDLLGNMEENSFYAGQKQKSSQFTLETLRNSIKSFILVESRNIASHRETFSKERKDYVISLGNVLLVFKKLNSMGLYQMIRAVDPTLLSDVRLHLIEALIAGSKDYYVTLYDSLLDESLDNDDEENQDEMDGILIGGSDIRVLIKLAQTLHKDLLLGKTVYHNVFLKILDIDYLGYVCDVIEKLLAADTNVTMKKVNALVNANKEKIHIDKKTSYLFQLYLAMRDLAAFIKKKAPSNPKSLKPSSPKRKVDTLRSPPTDINKPPPITLANYHDWFRPTLLNWLQMSKGNTRAVMMKAVEVDSVKRVDDIVKHTSSAVDTIACLTGVVTFWRNLQWPDPVDAYTIALRLTDDLANAIETYADLIYNKIRAAGFFDDVGQFDVTEDLCVALNNLQYVKSFLIDLPKKMDFQGIADAVDEHVESVSGEHVMRTFTSLCSTAEIGMKKKIATATRGAGMQIKREIRKFLEQFAQNILKTQDGAYGKTQDKAVRKKLEKKADDAVQPLMSYLQNNIATLNEWLCEPNFRRIIEILWDIVVRSMHRIILHDHDEERPGFFYQSLYIFDGELREFFHADGAGISRNKMNSEECSLLISELKMRSARTVDLLKLFYMQMYEEQQFLAAKLPFGYLNVYAWYDNSKKAVNIEVVSANKLVPLDLNGKSDPFVQIRLAPRMMFRNEEQHQTLVEKSTLDPVWTEESFTYNVEKSLAKEEGAVVIFTVLDHDILSSNDLEGEAVLPLNMLDGVENTKSNVSRHFKLPLVQPKKVTKASTLRRQLRDENGNGIINKEISNSFSDITLDDFGLDFASSLVVSPLFLLRARSSFDKDADEFYRWRRKLEKAKEESEQ